MSSSQPTFGTEAPKVQRSIVNLPASVLAAGEPDRFSAKRRGQEDVSALMHDRVVGLDPVHDDVVAVLGFAKLGWVTPW